MSTRRLQFWPWVLALPPLLAVIGGITMITLAVRTPSALVVDDYARIEELTSARFRLDAEAVRLGIAASLNLADDRIELLLDGAPPQPDELTLRLQHATDAALDRAVTLVRRGERFTADVSIVPGRYRFELMPPDGRWRLASGIVRSGGTVELLPQGSGS